MTKTINVSGRQWKEYSRTRFSALVKKPGAMTFEQRTARKAELQEAKALEKEYLDELRDKRHVKVIALRAKKLRKKEQEILHAAKCPGGVQLIKEPKKIKRLMKVARKSLVKMPPEFLENFLKR